VSLFRLYIQAKRALYFGTRARRKAMRFVRTEAAVTPAVPSSIPRKIWIYWDQGFDGAPPLVKRCIESWRDANPRWSIQVIDAGTFGDFAEMPDLPDSMSKNHKSDVLRTRLLNQHGGVWADATAWCLRSLDQWLPIVAQEGFFSFAWIDRDTPMVRTGPRRMLGSWFVAAASGNALIDAWDRQVLDYWQGRQSTSFYYWLHDAFEYCLRTDKDAANVWNNMPKLGAAGPHLAWHALERGSNIEAARTGIHTGAIPLLKLSWKMGASAEEVERFVTSCRLPGG